MNSYIEKISGKELLKKNKEIEIPEGYKAKIEGNKVIIELQESNDERIRKQLVDIVAFIPEANFKSASREDCRTYLEKQKEKNTLSTEETELNSIAFLEQLGYTCVPPGAEQKPVARENDFVSKPIEWSDNFEENVRNLLHDKLTWHSEDGSISSTVSIDDKTLKDIICGIWFYVGKEALKYPNKELNVTEWSEEDKEMVRRAIFYTEHYRTNYGDTKESEECFNWLLDLHKNIRPPFHWKPSEEQMKALENVIKCEFSSGLHTRGGIIQTLYNDLQKL